MKRAVKYTLIALGAAAVLAVVLIGVFLWSFTHANIDQSHGATSREKALSHCGIPLPSSAHDVEYASYASGLQDGEFYVRFKAPVSDCHATAQAIFAERAKAHPHFVIPTFQSVSHPPRAGSTRLRTGWFDTDHISKGIVAGTGYGWEPRIWIDEERGIFYYSVVD